jgi:hypothetical protein
MPNFRYDVQGKLLIPRFSLLSKIKLASLMGYFLMILLCAFDERCAAIFGPCVIHYGRWRKVPHMISKTGFKIAAQVVVILKHVLTAFPTDLVEALVTLNVVLVLYFMRMYPKALFVGHLGLALFFCIYRHPTTMGTSSTTP